MNILERFLILFETNSDKVEEGAKKARKPLFDLEKALHQSDHAAREMGEGFKEAMHEALGAVAAIVGAVELIHKGLEVEETADKMGKLAGSLHVSIEDLSAWSDAAQIAGGSAEGFQGSIRNLVGSMAQMDAVGRSRVEPFFREIGISMTDTHGKAKPVLGLLREMAGKFEHMSKQQSFGFGRKMGLDDGTIMMLQHGRRALDELIEKQRELGVYTQRDAEVAEKFFDTWEEAKHAFRSIGLEIGAELLPPLTSFFEMLEELAVWVRQHGTLVIGFFGALAGILTAIYVPAMLKAAWATLVATWPMLAIVAAIVAVSAAFALLYEDVVAYMNGFPSVIGKAMDHVIDLFDTMGASVRDIWNMIKQTILDTIDDIMKGIEKVKTFLHFGSDTRIGLDVANSHMQAASASVIPAQSAGAILTQHGGGKSTSVSIGEVNVHTQATDADGIARAIGDSMHAQIRQTISNSDDGIMG